MNIQARITRLEKLVDPNLCLTCGHERNPALVGREEAESKLQRLLPYFPDRASALEALRAADDEAASVLDYDAPGYCATCGADLLTPVLRAEADLADYLPNFATREEAIECLRENDPETAALLV